MATPTNVTPSTAGLKQQVINSAQLLTPANLARLGLLSHTQIPLLNQGGAQFVTPISVVSGGNQPQVSSSVNAQMLKGVGQLQASFPMLQQTIGQQVLKPLVVVPNNAISTSKPATPSTPVQLTVTVARTTS